MYPAYLQSVRPMYWSTAVLTYSRCDSVRLSFFKSILLEYCCINVHSVQYGAVHTVEIVVCVSCLPTVSRSMYWSTVVRAYSRCNTVPLITISGHVTVVVLLYLRTVGTIQYVLGIIMSFLYVRKSVQSTLYFQ